MFSDAVQIKVTDRNARAQCVRASVHYMYADEVLSVTKEG